jgi:hypothetical protein
MKGKHFRLACVAALAVLALAGSPALAQLVRTYGELEFQVGPEPKGNASHGYAEYRVYIRNKGSDSTYRVTLKVPGESLYGSSQGALQSITRSVSVGPGLVSVVSLFQPAAPDILGRDIAVFIDGRQMRDHLPLAPVSGRGMYGGYPYGRRGRMVYRSPMGPGGTQPLVLISQRLNETFFHHEIAGAGGGGAPPAFGPGGGPPGAGPGPAMGGGRPGMGRPGGFGGGPGVISMINAQFVRSDVPVSAWSSHWLGYTRYDGIVITYEDIHELQSGSNETRAALQALWQYAELGGVLLVLGPGKVPVPQAWQRHLVRSGGMDEYSVGFGKCLVAPDRNSKKWPQGRWTAIDTAVRATAMPWQSSKSLSDLNSTFPVVDNLGVPVIGLFVLMILFAIALGPVNLVVLSKKKKRIWMLWTVPALSALTCLAVFGYMIIAEGWQGHARIGGITFLDETSHRATSLGRTAFYSPLTPGGGLHFSEDSEVFMQGGGESAPSSCSIDWTQGQHLAHGWVTARVPAHFAIRSSETRRERLSVRREADGKLSLLNGLGVNIKKVTVADEKGLLYVAADVPAGERAKLERGTNRITGQYLRSWREEIYKNSDWTNAATLAQRRPPDFLGPRMYVAVVDGSPFHEQGLQGATVRNTESVVLGMMAEEGK